MPAMAGRCMDGILADSAEGLAMPVDWFMSGIDPERMPGMRLARFIGAADDFLPTLLCLRLLAGAGVATVAEAAGMAMPDMPP